MSGLVGRLRSVPSWQVTLSVALMVLGFLVAAQLSAEGPRIRYTSQERAPLIETVLGLQTRQDALKARILDLRGQISAAEGQLPGSAAQEKALNADLERSRIQAGLVQLQGPGLVFRLEDADAGGGVRTDGFVTARDVRIVVEELWLAGAEAIAINGERVVVTTAILDIGNAILVNSAYLAPTYEIRAIGPSELYGRISSAAAFVEYVRDRVSPSGLRLSFADLDSITIPAYAGTVGSRYMRIAPDGT